MKCFLAIALTLLIAPHALAAEPTEMTLQHAKAALLDGDYPEGVKRYQYLLALPDQGQHPEALEYLGVAYEKLGRAEQAKSSYASFLQRFADHPGASRVQQRLDVLAADALTTGGESSTSSRQRGPWSLYGGISQDYWLDSFEIDGAGEADSRTNLITFVNLGLDRAGERYDLRTRVDAGYRNELSRSDENSTAKDDEGLVSNAFVSVADRQMGLEASLGRQSLYADGVLGRFDGLRASYQWRDRIKFNTTLGLAVDAPRYLGDQRRPFAGVSAHLDDLAGQFDVQLFAIARRNEGQPDREAIGSEVHWRRDRLHVVGNFDYDLSFQTLNSAFVHTQFAMRDGLQLYARANYFAQPFLTTTNSLIGQPYNSLDTLADETGLQNPQLRTLARNRTAQAWTATAGFTATLSQRWYANGNSTYSDFEGTVASAGVEAAPRYQQFYSSIDLIGSSILRGGDTTIIGYRLQSTSTADTNTLRFEMRFPLGNSLRIGPMLNVSYRDAVTQGESQIIAEPGLRTTYRWGNRYRLELQARGRWSSRKSPTALRDSPLYTEDDERSAAYFFQLGWRADL